MKNVRRITRDQASDFAWGAVEGYEEISTKTFMDNLYKDYAPAETICKDIKDGTFWRLCWDKYCSHYGAGEHEYETELVQVELHEVEVKVIKKEWKVVEI